MAAAAAAPPNPHALLAAELASKVREYEQFANDVLKADLQATSQLRAKLMAEVEELAELARNVEALQAAQESGQRSMKSRVELGSGVFCRAVVPDTSRLFISIGLGFHLEVTLAEAGPAIQLQQQALQARIDACTNKAARIKANLKFVAEAIRELSGL